MPARQGHRPPHLSPKGMAMVTRKYAETYFEVISSAVVLDYKGLGWDTNDLMILSRGFIFCSQLLNLTLSENHIRKLEAGCFNGLSE